MRDRGLDIATGGLLPPVDTRLVATDGLMQVDEPVPPCGLTVSAGADEELRAEVSE